jgi:hypothetical protein
LREFTDLLPPEAKEHRLIFFRWNPRTQTKRSSAIGFMLLSRLKESDLATNPHALEMYLHETYGPDMYRVEPSDEHSHKIDKLASWTVDARGDDMTDDQDPVGDRERDDRDRGRGDDRSRRHRGKYDDKDDDRYGDEDDEEDDRLSDIVAGLGKKTADNNFSMMQMMQMQDERRREERKDDERRAEAQRRQDEERRHEERKAEEERHREEREAAAKRDTERLTLLGGIITAATGILGPILAKPKDDHLPLLIEAMKPRPMDPMVMKLLDNASSKEQQQAMFAGMAEVQKMGSAAQAEAFKSVMVATNDLQTSLLKRAMEMYAGGGKDDDEGSTSTLHDIAEIVSGATKLLPNGFGGSKPAALPAPAPAPAPVAQVQAQVPKGTEAVIVGMKALQQHVAPNGTAMGGAEEAAVEQFILNEIPDDLAEAIVNGDEAKVMAIAQPVILAHQEYIQWITQKDVQAWVQNYFGQLRPKLQKLYQEEAPAAPARPSPAPAPAPVQSKPAPVQTVLKPAPLPPLAGPGSVPTVPVGPPIPPPPSQNLPTKPPAAAQIDPDAPV